MLYSIFAMGWGTVELEPEVQIASGRRIVLLTVVAKTRMRERAEIERARRAMERCIAERHTAEEVEIHG